MLRQRIIAYKGIISASIRVRYSMPSSIVKVTRPACKYHVPDLRVVKTAILIRCWGLTAIIKDATGV